MSSALDYHIVYIILGAALLAAAVLSQVVLKRAAR
jgi:hypothetical protein